MSNSQGVPRGGPVQHFMTKADDLPELFFLPYGDKKDVMLAILSQNSKLDPRSSFYTVDSGPRYIFCSSDVYLITSFGDQRMFVW